MNDKWNNPNVFICTGCDHLLMTQEEKYKDPESKEGKFCMCGQSNKWVRLWKYNYLENTPFWRMKDVHQELVHFASWNTPFTPSYIYTNNHLQ